MSKKKKFVSFILAMSMMFTAFVQNAAISYADDPINDPDWGEFGEFNTSYAPNATLFVVGDSTGCDYAPSEDATYYYKRVGFGTPLNNYFVDNINVVNYALSGRSSKSFISEEYYTKLLNEMKEGDYLLIAFGHNDEKSDDASRYTKPITNPETENKDTEGTFQYSLYHNYILPAQEKGVTPILATPIVRRTNNDKFSDSELHIANGGSYPEDIRNLGKELGLTVIDNTEITKKLYERCGKEVTPYFHAWLQSDISSRDNTHLNNYGANVVSYLMTRELKLTESELGKYVKDVAVPTRNMLTVNPDYVESVSGDFEKSVLWKTTDPWWASVFGDIGTSELRATKLNEETGEQEYIEPAVPVGNDSLGGKPLYEISEEVVSRSAFDCDLTGDYVTDSDDAIELYKAAIGERELSSEQQLKADVDEDGKITANDAANMNITKPQNVAVLRVGIAEDENGNILTKEAGKISSTNDGMACYFRRVPSNMNFTIKAKATIRKIPEDVKNNQIAFGAIVSQDMYMDKNTGGGIKGGYIAVGGLDMGKIGQKTDVKDEAGNVIGTKTEAMTGAWQRANGALTKQKSKLAEKPKVGDSYNISITKVGNKYTLTFDDEVYEMTADYKNEIYPGFFAVRCIEVEYSNIVFNNEVVE